jgi:riboflavin kinase/FMN adenylyltransferase
MMLLRYAAAVPPIPTATVAAWGRFDALHLGHQELLRRLRQEADRLAGRSLVVGGSGTGEALDLTSWRQRLRLFASWGVDILLCPRTASPAVDWDLLKRLGVAVLVSAEPLRPRGGVIRVQHVDAVQINGERIDDAAIRAAIRAADLAGAAALLGRLYAIDGRIVHGFHRGRPLGIPTANLRVRNRLLPPDGVYAVRAGVRGQALGGVANIGVKPTFGDERRSVETHLFDFAADIYGEHLEIAFVRRIRDEQRFSSVDDLLAQIRRDIAAARQILAES